MAFDLSIVKPSHFWLLGGCFVAAYGLLALLLRPESRSLRRHVTQEVAYGGVVLLGIISLANYFTLTDVRLKVGLLAATFLILVVGIIDEHVTLKPAQQLLWQVIIALVAVTFGWTIRLVSHPWQSGVLQLDWVTLGPWVFPGAILGMVWLVLLMNTVNWLDGVDGLASGVGLIALITLALVSVLPSTQDAMTLQLALIGTGGLLGFLLWNFPAARVYLGTTGSWFLGLYIGMIAIVGGGKIATTLLVLAIPVIDVVAVVLQRLWRRQPIWQGDTQTHLHHRLLAQGLSARQIVLLAMALSAILGIAALTLQTQEKLVAFTVAACMLALLLLRLIYRQTNVATYHS